MERRQFLRLSAGAAGAALASARAFAAPSPVHVTLRPGVEDIALPADFTGLSYETAQLSNPDFFSGANMQLAAFVNRLGKAGVLRIGGNTSAYSVWTETPAPVSPDAVFGPDTGRQAPPRRPVGPAAIRNLRDFLDATGWTLIYGLNMGGETPEVVAEEAAYVMRTIGPKLTAFQLCNEPDLFARNGVRKPGYDYADFAAEWQRHFTAVRARVPDAPFAGPDNAFSEDWLVPFAERFKKDVLFLTEHYYAEGPPTDPAMTIARLLRPDPKLAAVFDGMVRTRRATGLAFRMAETNSCWGGGKQGVSDTFAAALWGGDLMFRLAQRRGTGINFHGGAYGWYTPIAGAPQRGFVARPLYYGMLLFAEAGTGALIKTDIDGASDLFAAYGLRHADGTLKLAVFNKDAHRDVPLLADPGGPAATATVLRLTAPRLADTTDVTFGGAPVGAKADWAPLITERVALKGGVAAITIPKASGALVTFG